MPGEQGYDSPLRAGAQPEGGRMTPLPRAPSGGFNEFGHTDSHSRPVTPSQSTSGRRPLPAQPPLPPVPSGSYPAFTTPPPAGPVTPAPSGRRALPTPPSLASSTGSAPLPRPGGAKALPSLPPGGYRSASGHSLPPLDGPPPPPPPRPNQPYSTGSYSSAGRQLPPVAAPLPGPPIGIQVDDKYALQKGLPVFSSTSSYTSSPSPSRSSSRHPSNAPSRTASSPTTDITRNTSLSTHEAGRDEQTNRKYPSGVEESWLPMLERFGDLGAEHGGGASDGVVSGGLAPPKVPNEVTSGRGTPTQRDWLHEPPSMAYLEGRGRNRAASAATIGPGNQAYPTTPTADHDIRFQDQGGILGGTQGYDDGVSFPVPPGGGVQQGHGDEEGTWNSNETMTGMLRREGSTRSAATDYSVQASNADARSVSALSFQSSGYPDSPHRQASIVSSLHPGSISSRQTRRSMDLSPSWQQQTQPPAHWVERKLQIHQSHQQDGYDEDGGPSGYDDEDDWDDEVEEEMDVNEIRFFQPAFVSEMALQLRDKVERGRHIKAGIAWVGSFTGKDIVTTIQNLLPPHTRESNTDRRFAHMFALSLQNQLWFVEVDWDIKPLRDSSDDVFRFMGEMEGMGSGGDALTTELPKGLMTMATRCYSPSCTGDARCYAPRCPNKTNPNTFLDKVDTAALPTPASVRYGDWKEDVDPMILRDLDQGQMARQEVIRQALSSEVAYEADLTAMERLFMEGIRNADPPVIRDEYRREQFIHEVFNNAMELREACRRLIEEFTIRMREQPIVLFVGDLFLQAATEFRNIYPEYTGRLPQAEAALTKEMDDNPEFRLFVERVIRENDRRRDIKYLITRPSTQLQRYPAVLEGILNATDADDPDRDFLFQALQSIQNISSLSQLKLFHASRGRGPAGKLQWFDLVPEEQRAGIEKKEQKRQMQIWELIQGEMEYVADLETMDNLFVNGLRLADPAVIDRNRLDVFLDEVFHNYRSLLDVHSRLLENLQFRQLEQHPHFGMISDLIFDAALNWQEAYMEYVTHYPIAKAKVQEEEHRNPKFAKFLQQCLKDPSANRQDVYHFINRPIPRLLRYNLLLADILKSLKEVGPPDHPDIDQIPGVMEVITDLGKATQKGVAVNESKVELWGFQHTLDGSRFGPRMVKDLDLANPMRELIHKGRVFRQPEGSIGGSWTELIVLLFDHYLVLTKPERSSRSSRKEHRQVRYIINRRPIPLELLSLGQFSDASRQRDRGRLFGVGTSSSDAPDGGADSNDRDNRTVYPFSISFIGQGQLGGSYTLWADSASGRDEWREKLKHAKVLRLEVNDAGKVFEMIPLAENTFYMAPNYAVPKDKEDKYTGRVTCSCPFTTSDRRKLVAIGCQDGVWIGVRGESASLRKVLHVKSVTNVAVLEEFGMFLVLSEKALFAYHLEALVPSAGQRLFKTAPERVSIPREEISFFTVGRLDGRTLVVTMKKETAQSVFRILEPVLNRSAEDSRQRRGAFNFLGKGSDWFRPYKMFYLPAEVYGLHFLKHKMAIVCSKGFEIMDLTDLKGGSIPIFEPSKIREKPILSELQRKCEAARPLGMFRSTETEFLLCYDSFGIYVDRHGEPNRDCRAIEWEGRPDSIAFHPPYLLLISAPFIEIRHINTAKLLQIYTGSDLRLTWDGSGGQRNQPVDNPGKDGYGEETKIQEPQIHICQRAPDLRQLGRSLQGVGQHVFELSPTLLLNNPLMNPFNGHDSNYLPPPPLTSHATPQIRQARPPSIMTTSSAEYSPGGPYQSGPYGTYPSSNGYRDSGYGTVPMPRPTPLTSYSSYGYGGYVDGQQHAQRGESYIGHGDYSGGGGFTRRESGNSTSTGFSGVSGMTGISGGAGGGAAGYGGEREWREPHRS
ncbi:hypothetical protein IAU60_003101 [Kwoniella sp. DSM 27419]